VAQHLQRDAIVAVLAFREINRGQIARVDLRDEAPFQRTVQRLVVREQLGRSVPALDLELAAHDVDQTLMLDAVLRKEIGGARFQ
jgi:hypothetical protein